MCSQLHPGKPTVNDAALEFSLDTGAFQTINLANGGKLTVQQLVALDQPHQGSYVLPWYGGKGSRHRNMVWV